MLKLKDIENIIFGNAPLSLNERELTAVADSYNFLKNFSKDKVIYGINTGFGPMAQYRVGDDKLHELQYNIIRSHACGAGEALGSEYVKAAMLARLYTFVQGKSGVHPQVVELLSEFINRGIYPLIPEHGSVGASGDLVQLAHIALALIGEGEVFYNGEKLPAQTVLKENNLKPLSMHIREGLAVCNGTSLMTGIGIINLILSKKLLEFATLSSLMVNEIAGSYDDFMSEALNDTKVHAGQRQIAARMRELSAGGRCMKQREMVLYKNNREKIFKDKLQPFYSLRCVPQILGPILDEINNAEKVLVDEINSADDNPIVDAETKNVYHGGNFHGDYVSFEMDKLKIAVTKLTMLAERQMNYLFHDKINEILPPFLNRGTLGLNYGLQAVQFTATSTTAESQVLSNPVYIHSIPCNNDNQDIVSMGTNSALITKKVIENAYQVIAVHFMAIAQAVDCLGIRQRLSAAGREMYSEIRKISPAFTADAPKYTEIEKMTEFFKAIK